ncbi:MAG: hypothetical protein Q9219_005699 [cf. Caloplaca sp. 3 TL-2023]
MSLRDRFGRLWGRINDPNSTSTRDQLSTEMGNGKTPPEKRPCLDSEPEKKHELLLTPRRLHKAASTTFQAISDSLRSKAQALYTPSNAMAASPKIPERQTSTSSPRRSKLWSSVRGRRSHDSPKGEITLEPELETSFDLDFSPIGPAPVISTAIPTSPLQTALKDDDITTPPVVSNEVPIKYPAPSLMSILPYKPQRLWPSPQMALRALSITEENPPPPFKALEETDKLETPPMDVLPEPDKPQRLWPCPQMALQVLSIAEDICLPPFNASGETDELEIPPMDVLSEPDKPQRLWPSPRMALRALSITNEMLPPPMRALEDMDDLEPPLMGVLPKRPRRLWPNPRSALRALSITKELPPLPLLGALEETDDLEPSPKSVLPERPQRLWPNPSIALRALSITQETPPPFVMASYGTGKTQSSLARKEMGLENLSALVPSPIWEETARSSLASMGISGEDIGYDSDTESNSGTFTTNASTNRTSISRPPSVIAACDLTRSFAPARQSNEDFTGTFWPANKVIKSAGRASRSFASNGICALDTEHPYAQAYRPTNPPSPHLTSHLFNELGPDDQMGENLAVGMSNDTKRIPSEAYEADTEAKTSSPQVASMGPRLAWDAIRAKRAKRYAAVQLGELSWDDSTDEDSEFGFRLTTKPSSPYLNLPNQGLDEQVNQSRGTCKAPQSDQEAPLPDVDLSASPLEASDKSRLETPPPLADLCSSSTSHEMGTAPVVPIEKFLEDRSLRHRLLDGCTDFILGETLNGQDASTPEDRFLVTSRLDPNDPFEANLASFGRPGWTLHDSFKQSLDGIIPGSPASEEKNDICSGKTQLPTHFVSPSLLDLPFRLKPGPRQPGLTEEIYEEAVSKECSSEVDEAADSKGMSAAVAFPNSHLENDSEPRPEVKVSCDESQGRSSPFEDVPSTCSDHVVNSATLLGPSLDIDSAPNHRGEPTKENNRPLSEGLVIQTSRRSASPTAQSEYPDLRHYSNGEKFSIKRSSSNSAKRPNARKLGTIPSRKFTPPRPYAERNIESHKASFSSSWVNGSFNQREWLEAHYNNLKQQIAQDSARDRPNKPEEPRQRLVDVSMVKRREELNKKASVEALCQFIYRCERESEAEEAKEMQEDEDGYTAAMFQNN